MIARPKNSKCTRSHSHRGPAPQRESKSGWVSFWKLWTEFKKKKGGKKKEKRTARMHVFLWSVSGNGNRSNIQGKEGEEEGEEEAGDETVATPSSLPAAFQGRMQCMAHGVGMGGVMGVFEFQVWEGGREGRLTLSS